MRVALLTNFIPPYRVPLYEALEREVGELRVFVSTPMEANRDWEADWGALDVMQQRTITLNRTWRTRAFDEKYQLHLPYDTALQLRRYRPDVILTGEMGARSLQAALYGRLARTPVVLWAMLSDRLEIERGGLRRAVRKWLIRNVHSIIVNGESAARYFHRFGVGDERILRVHQSVDMRALLALPIDKDAHTPPRLLHVGSVSQRKGVHLLFDALVRIAKNEPTRRLKLTMVGDGPLRTTLQERELPPNLQIEWAGSVPYAELPQWYANADVLVFPSLGDEWGLVVNEALAAGVPVMGSIYSQAVEELIRDGENGWSFEPDSSTAVEAALERVLQTTPEMLEQMRINARRTIEHWTPAAAAARIAQQLREAAQ